MPADPWCGYGAGLRRKRRSPVDFEVLSPPWRRLFEAATPAAIKWEKCQKGLTPRWGEPVRHRDTDTAMKEKIVQGVSQTPRANAGRETATVASPVFWSKRGVWH